MTRKRKTPPVLLALMKNQENYIYHTDEQLRVKREVHVDSQADHIRQRSEDQMIGRAEGINLLLEQALMDYGCYAGFMYVGKPVLVKSEQGFTIQYTSVGPDHPEFAEWRRRYFTRT